MPILAFIAAFFILLSFPDAYAADAAVAKSVELRALNKVTARSSAIKGSLLTPMEFGKLTIVVKACWIAPTDRRPEHAALMEVTEAKPGEESEVIFSGWMFASSPALSSLEHPVYDLTVIACHVE